MVSLAEHLQRADKRSRRGSNLKSTTTSSFSTATEATWAGSAFDDDYSVTSFSSFSVNNCSFRPEDSVSCTELEEHELAVYDISLVDAVQQKQPKAEPQDDDNDILVIEEEEPVVTSISLLEELNQPGEEDEPGQPSPSAVTDFLHDRWFTFTRNMETINNNWNNMFNPRK